MTEPKLLTEAEAKGAWSATYRIHAKSFDEYLAELRERGLIAPERVAPVRLMAVQIMDYLNPQGDEQDINWIVNTILRPGIDALELAERPTLTREMVREAVQNAFVNADMVYLMDDKEKERLADALTERLK